MKRLFLHIGTHKTGSTAIQHALQAHVKLLRKHGYALVPRFQAARELMRISCEDPQIIDHARDQFQRSLRYHRKYREDKLIMSWEGFSGDPWAGYTNSEIIAKSLRKITSGLDVTIIVYLRRQDEFLESLYAQHIQRGYSLSFNEYLDQIKPSYFDWEFLLQNYAKHFGKKNILPRRYHKVFLPTKSSLLDDFSRAIEIPFHLTLPGNCQRNSSMSRQALEIARLANPHLSPDEQKCLRTLLQESNAKHLFSGFGFFSSSSRSEFLSRYKASNAFVCTEYFDGPRGFLFPDDPPPAIDPAQESGLIEDPGRVLANIVRYLHSQKAACSHGGQQQKFVQQVSERLSRLPRLRRWLRSLARGLHP